MHSHWHAVLEMNTRKICNVIPFGNEEMDHGQAQRSGRQTMRPKWKWETKNSQTNAVFRCWNVRKYLYVFDCPLFLWLFHVIRCAYSTLSHILRFVCVTFNVTGTDRLKMIFRSSQLSKPTQFICVDTRRIPKTLAIRPNGKWIKCWNEIGIFVMYSGECGSIGKYGHFSESMHFFFRRMHSPSNEPFIWQRL